LTGKYQPGALIPADSRQAEKPEWSMALTDDLFAQISRLESDAKAKQRTLFQHALLALLENPVVVSLIIGVKRIAQLEAAIYALG
jgi:aryl-alcohol dehydrogenase-like predicted oxidoreductase